MSCPSSITRPVTRAPGIVSCIRLRQRRNVDFPQPDGPMIAVTDRSRETDGHVAHGVNGAEVRVEADRRRCESPA